MIEYITILSSILAFVSVGLLISKFLRKPALGVAILSISMLLYALGALSEFIAAVQRIWSVNLYKFYYGISPIQVGLLGAGILGVYLNRGRLRYSSYVYLIYVVILSVPLIITVSSAPVDVSKLSEVFVGGMAMPSYVRRWSPPLTIPSGLLTIIIPLYYYFKIKKTRHAFLIPLASLIVMIGGFAARAGRVEVFYTLEFLGSATLAYAFYIFHSENQS